MPLTYVESSALIKRYVPEVGSAWVARLCDEEPVAISLITLPEFASALARRTREGNLGLEQRDDLFQALVRDAASFTIIGVDGPIAQRTAALLLKEQAAVRPRTLDALHVASAQSAFDRARRRGIATGSFVTADGTLRETARAVGLDVIDPEDYEE